MKMLKSLRLLLDIYGALFLLVIAGGAIIGGLLPYQSFLELGAIGFYATLGFGIVLWLVLAALLRRKPLPASTPPVPPPQI